MALYQNISEESIALKGQTVFHLHISEVRSLLSDNGEVVLQLHQTET
jgi:hypothetical protein